jgi:hypothetical protein
MYTDMAFICSTANVPAWWCWRVLCADIASASEILRPGADGSDSRHSALARSATGPAKCPGRCLRFPKHAGPIPNSPSRSRRSARLHAKRTVSKTYHRYQTILEWLASLLSVLCCSEEVRECCDKLTDWTLHGITVKSPFVPVFSEIVFYI